MCMGKTAEGKGGGRFFCAFHFVQIMKLISRRGAALKNQRITHLAQDGLAKIYVKVRRVQNFHLVDWGAKL